MAESEGFEPPEGFPSTVFKTAAFDHSASSPVFLQLMRQLFYSYLIRYFRDMLDIYINSNQELHQQ